MDIIKTSVPEPDFTGTKWKLKVFNVILQRLAKGRAEQKRMGQSSNCNNKI